MTKPVRYSTNTELSFTPAFVRYTVPVTTNLWYLHSGLSVTSPRRNNRCHRPYTNRLSSRTLITVIHRGHGSCENCDRTVITNYCTYVILSNINAGNLVKNIVIFKFVFGFFAEHIFSTWRSHESPIGR